MPCDVLRGALAVYPMSSYMSYGQHFLHVSQDMGSSLGTIL